MGSMPIVPAPGGPRENSRTGRRATRLRSTLAGTLLIAFSHAAEPAWSPSRQIDTATVRDTALSAVGERVAFTVRRAVWKAGAAEWRHRVWVGGSNEPSAAPFSSITDDCFAPSFSNDGVSIAYLCRNGTGAQIRVRQLHGGPARRVTRAALGVEQFLWSPVTGRLAYLAADPAEQFPLHPSLKAANRPPRHLFHLDLDLPPTGFPGAIQISWGPFDVSDFTWSPDGTRIAYARRPDTYPDTGLVASDLGVLQLAGRGLRRGSGLRKSSGTDVAPLWSSDSRWIAFASSGDRPEPIGLGDLHIISADGTELRQLAATQERGLSPPIGWNAASDQIYIAEAAGTATHLLGIPIDGDPPVVHLGGTEHRSAFSISADGSTVAFVQEAPDSPQEVFVWRPGAQPLRVSALHRRSATPTASRTELFTWTSFDGLPIEGLLTRPTDPAGPSPLAVWIHGGPAARSVASFTGSPETFMVESLVAEGWSILRPNYRGSLGYGPAFRSPPIGAWGEPAAIDIRYGIEALVAGGVARRDEIFIAGWGYGAHLALLLASDTAPPRALSIGAPLTDIYALATATDIPSYLTEYFPAPAVFDPGPYRRASLLERAPRIAAPVQIFHGELDRRIPVGQSRALFNALRLAGSPAELVLLPSATGQPTNPNELLALQEELHKWWRQHLRPRPRIEADRPQPQPRRAPFIPSEYEPYGQAGDGVIEGAAYLETPGGGRHPCALALVFMNPVTTFSTEWYVRNVLRREELEPVEAPSALRFHWITRSDTLGRFRFVDLPRGDYYLGCRAIPTEGFAHGRATVRPGEVTYVNLTRQIGVEP